MRQLLSRCVRAVQILRRQGVDVSGSTLAIGVHLYEDNLMVNLGIEPEIMRHFVDYGVGLSISVYKSTK